MRKYRSLLLGTLVLLLLAGLSGLVAWRMLISVINYRSPIHANPPSPGEALGSPLSRKVVIVLVDALRLDTSLKTSLMPFLNELRQQGASAAMHSRPPSFSQPGYATLLTGAWPDLNDSPVLNLEHPGVNTFTQDDLFSAAHRIGLKTAISGYYFFETLVPQAVVDASFYTHGEDAAADAEVMQAARPFLNGEASLVLIHLDQVDYAGHYLGGPRSLAWDSAAKKADEYLRQIASTLDLTQDTLIVLSDHGQIDRGGHGGPEPINLLEPFVMVGAGVRAGQYPDMQQVDVAPTVATLLGTNIPASTQGDVVKSMLVLSADELDHLPATLTKQKALLFDAYAWALKQPASIDPNPSDASGYLAAMDELRSTKLAREQIGRSILAVMLGILPPIVLIVRKQRNVFWRGIGALIYVLVFNFRYAIVDGLPYSLSWIESETGFGIYVATTTAIALGIAWIVIMGRMNAFNKSPRRAARASMGLIFMIVYLLLLPVLFNFAVNGLQSTWTLPEFYTIFVALLALVQIILVVVFGLVLTGGIALITRLTPHSRYSTA